MHSPRSGFAQRTPATDFVAGGARIINGIAEPPSHVDDLQLALGECLRARVQLEEALREMLEIVIVSIGFAIPAMQLLKNRPGITMEMKRLPKTLNASASNLEEIR